MTQQEIKNLRNLAKTNIEEKSSLVLEVYKAGRRIASLEACSKTDWFLLEVMEKLSGEKCDTSWLH